MVLRMESLALPILVESWLGDQPLKKLQPGKVHIVEFWATSCGTCVAAIPNLAQLQGKYKDSGIEIVRVAAHERAATADAARTKLDAWLTEEFSNLNDRIGFDYTSKMNRLLLNASRSVGIPTSFVVDRGRHIAFIGRPTQLHEVLSEVVNGVWRTSDDAKAADTGWTAEGKFKVSEMTRRRALAEPNFEKLMPAMKAENWGTALSAIEEAVAVMPGELKLPRGSCGSVAPQNARHAVDRCMLMTVGNPMARRWLPLRRAQVRLCYFDSQSSVNKPLSERESERLLSGKCRYAKMPFLDSESTAWEFFAED